MQNKRIAITKNVLSGILSIFIFLLLVFFLIEFSVDIVFMKTDVKGYSMRPTINQTAPNMDVDWDTVYINRYKACEREDVVVANVPWYSNSIIKRLVAVPGDTIRMQLKDDYYELYVNEQFVRKEQKTTYTIHTNSDGTNRYIPGGTEAYYAKYLKIINNESSVADFSNNITTNENGQKCIKLNKNEYFLMGDNWAETTDCMTYGPVSGNCFVGKVELIIEHNKNSTQEFVAYLWRTLFS